MPGKDQAEAAVNNDGTNNAAVAIPAAEDSASDDDDVDPNDVVPASSKAKKIKEALQKATESHPAPNARPAIDVRQDEEAATKLAGILPPGWAYKSFKRHTPTISSSSLKQFRAMELLSKNNKKMRTPFHKAHEEVILKASSDWVEIVSNDPMKAKGFMNMTDSKLKKLIEKIEEKEGGGGEIEDDLLVAEDALEAIENERVLAEAEMEAEEMIVPDEAFGEIDEEFADGL